MSITKFKGQPVQIAGEFVKELRLPISNWSRPIFPPFLWRICVESRWSWIFFRASIRAFAPRRCVSSTNSRRSCRERSCWPFRKTCLSLMRVFARSRESRMSFPCRISGKPRSMRATACWWPTARWKGCWLVRWWSSTGTAKSSIPNWCPRSRRSPIMTRRSLRWRDSREAENRRKPAVADFSASRFVAEVFLSWTDRTSGFTQDLNRCFGPTSWNSVPSLCGGTSSFISIGACRFSYL